MRKNSNKLLFGFFLGGDKSLAVTSHLPFMDGVHAFRELLSKNWEKDHPCLEVLRKSDLRHALNDFLHVVDVGSAPVVVNKVRVRKLSQQGVQDLLAGVVFIIWSKTMVLAKNAVTQRDDVGSTWVLERIKALGANRNSHSVKTLMQQSVVWVVQRVLYTRFDCRFRVRVVHQLRIHLFCFWAFSP